MKKEIELTYTNPQDIVKSEIIPTIHDKYKELINAANTGNISGLWSIDSIYEIKRWLENRIGRSLPIEWNCEDCIISLIKQFNNLKN